MEERERSFKWRRIGRLGIYNIWLYDGIRYWSIDGSRPPLPRIVPTGYTRRGYTYLWPAEYEGWSGKPHIVYGIFYVKHGMGGAYFVSGYTNIAEADSWGSLKPDRWDKTMWELLVKDRYFLSHHHPPSPDAPSPLRAVSTSFAEEIIGKIREGGVADDGSMKRFVAEALNTCRVETIIDGVLKSGYSGTAPIDRWLWTAQVIDGTGELARRVSTQMRRWIVRTELRNGLKIMVSTDAYRPSALLTIHTNMERVSKLFKTSEPPEEYGLRGMRGFISPATDQDGYEVWMRGWRRYDYNSVAIVIYRLEDYVGGRWRHGHIFLYDDIDNELVGSSYIPSYNALSRLEEALEETPPPDGWLIRSGITTRQGRHISWAHLSIAYILTRLRRGNIVFYPDSLLPKSEEGWRAMERVFHPLPPDEAEQHYIRVVDGETMDSEYGVAVEKGGRIYMSGVSLTLPAYKGVEKYHVLHVKGLRPSNELDKIEWGPLPI